MKIIINPRGWGIMNHVFIDPVHTHIRKYGSLHSVPLVNLAKPCMNWNEHLADKARSLIFSERKYADLTPEEKKIVDFYQQKKLEEDAVILPNTGAALEQAEIEQMLLKRHKEHHKDL